MLCLPRLVDTHQVSADAPVVISKFLEGAEEIDIDAVSDHGVVKAFAIAEHIEQGGVHSGDASLVLPAPNITPETFTRLKDIVFKIAAKLEITGPLNMQVLHTPEGELKVIETNVRGSRSLPFSSKVLDIDFTSLATRAMLGLNPPSTVEVALCACWLACLRACGGRRMRRKSWDA